MTEDLVKAIIEDPETADISPGLRVTLRMLERLTRDPSSFEATDAAAALDAGVPKAALEEAILVCFVLSVILRFVDAFGFPSRTTEERKSLGANLMRFGYSMAAVPGASRTSPFTRTCEASRTKEGSE